MSKWTVCGKIAGLFLKEKGSGDLNQEMGGWMEREWTRATLSVHTKTPLYAYTRSPLHPIPGHVPKCGNAWRVLRRPIEKSGANMGEMRGTT